VYLVEGSILDKENNDETIKRMADLLRQGNTLTNLSCPACASPLFRLKDQTLWCAKDQKKVIVLKQGEEEIKTGNQKYNKVEQTLLSKVDKLQAKIENTENIDELQKLSATLLEVLTTLGKINEMKKK
jgi:uncharacterized Zn finger protein (UPF0148 family)